MAAATVTETEYGFMVTGGTTATTINSGTLRVRALAFAGNADNATCVLTSLVGAAATATSCFKFKTNANDLDCGESNVYFGEKGVCFTGLALTLSNAADILYVYLV